MRVTTLKATAAKLPGLLAYYAGLAYMEPVDVANGEYDEVFDDTGRRYRFEVVDEATQLEPRDEVDLDALRQRLRDLMDEGAYRSLEGFDPDDPLGAAAAIARWEWEQGGPDGRRG